MVSTVFRIDLESFKCLHAGDWFALLNTSLHGFILLLVFVMEHLSPLILLNHLLHWICLCFLPNFGIINIIAGATLALSCYGLFALHLFHLDGGVYAQLCVILKVLNIGHLLSFIAIYWIKVISDQINIINILIK